MSLRAAVLLSSAYIITGVAPRAQAETADAAPGPTVRKETVATAPSGAAASTASRVAEVVVTAQRRQENIENVGMSIQAATGQKLTQLGITDPSQLTKIVPGFTYLQSSYGTPIFAIRGVSFQTQDLNASPAVSVYVDEVPLPYSIMTTGSALDVQRVEVLKGPQGTLYGENSTGGAVNFVANKPTSTTSGGLDLSYGRFNAVDFQGFISGPIAPSLEGRLAFHTAQSGPWQQSYTHDAQLGRQNVNNGRLILDWKPNRRLKAELTASAFLDKSETQAAQLFGHAPAFAGAIVDPRISSYPIAPQTDRAADWGACVNTSGFYPPYDQIPAPYGYDPERPSHSTSCTGYHQNNTQTAVSLRVDYKINDDLMLTSISSHQHFDRYTPLDETGMIYADYQTLQTGKVVSNHEELRLAGKFGERGSWIVGGNYEATNTFDGFLDDYANSSYSPTFGLPLYGDRVSAKTSIRTWAAFTNGEYEILPHLKLVGGVRYTAEDQEAHSCIYDSGNGQYANVAQAYANYAEVASGYITADQYANGGPGLGQDATGAFGFALNPGPGGCSVVGPGPTFNPVTTPLRLDESNVSWRVGLDWQLQPRTLLYALVSKGYKAGSFPAVSATLYSEFAAARQESLVSFETGLKRVSFNNTLVTNMSAYYYLYNDKQILGYEIDPIFGPLSHLVNVPNSHIIGAEASGSWKPQFIPGLVITPSANFTYSRIDSCKASEDNQDPNQSGQPGCYDGSYHNVDVFGSLATFTGHSLPNAPRWQANIDAEYDWQVNTRLTGYLGGNVSYQASSTGLPISAESPYPSDTLDISSYALLDLRAGIIGPNWRFEFFGRNVTNDYYWNNALHVTDVLIRYTGRPATYGARVSYRYN